jgi:hypothetical protein
MEGRLYGNGQQLTSDTAELWATQTMESWEQVDVGPKALILLWCLE